MTPEEASHPTMEALLDYFAGELPDTAGSTIELHMSSCDACAARGEEIFLLDEVWRSWNARRHGGLHLRVTLARALAKAEQQVANREWRERLQHWRKAWAGTAEVALRTVLSAPAQASRTVAAGLEVLTRPGSPWSFAPEPQAAGTWGEEDEDNDAAAIATSTLSPDQPRALVELKGGGDGEIVVRIDNLPAGGAAPLVLLIAVSADRDVIVQVAEVKLRQGTNSHFARFSKLRPGEYIVAFEPTGSSTGP